MLFTLLTIKEREGNYVNISKDRERAFGKIQYLLTREKTIMKLRIEWNSLNLIKDINKKFIANFIIKGEALKVFL